MADLSSIVGDLDRLMESVQREAEQARDRQRDPQLEAAGSALDGQVTVKLSPDGRVSELVLADEVMRLTAPELAREIVSAVNQAWAAGKSADPAAMAAAIVDPAALAERMNQLRQESLDNMSRITDSLTDVMRKIDRRLDS